MSNIQNDNNAKSSKKEPKINASTHVQIQLGVKKTVWMPRERIRTRDIVNVDTAFFDKLYFTGEGDMMSYLSRHLSRLSQLPINAHDDLIHFVNELPKAGYEAFVQLLLEIGYNFPTSQARPGKEVKAEWPEYLFDRIEICTNAGALLKLCRCYDWYIGASRRVVTLAHVSKKGLTKSFLRAVGKIAETEPSLAFALSPTTLHENTLVAPDVAKFFTCDPLHAKALNAKSTYYPVIRQDAFKNVEIGTYNDFNQRPTSTEAIRRVKEAMGFLYGAKGEFPWQHPKRADTGVLLAGGFPCAALLSKERFDEILPKTDLDFFVYSPDDDGQREMGEIILRHMEKLGGKLQKVVIGNEGTEGPSSKVLTTACVFQVTGLKREIQVIFPFAFSPLGVLINFDSTFIQVGYQEVRKEGSSPVPTFMATPGYCFFTPHSETLITRYNIRYYRLWKMLARGFIPVSDERGHLLYPARVFFSSRWKLALQGEAKKTPEDTRISAIRMYIVDKKIKRDVLEAKLGVEALAADERAAFLTLPETFFEDKEIFNYLMVAAASSTKSYNESAQSHRVTIWGPRGEEKKMYSCWAGKPAVTWIDTTADEAMMSFDPQGATLSNGFDIYTAGINNTLPVPADGQTDDLYECNVLLRNVEILPPKEQYNLAAPEERPLKVKFVSFPDEQVKYPGNIYEPMGKEPVRTIEGIFLFSDCKTEEEIDAEYIESEKRRLAGWEKFQRKVDLRARLKNERVMRDLKSREDSLIRLKEQLADAERVDDDATAEKLEARIAALKDQLAVATAKEEKRLEIVTEYKEAARAAMNAAITMPKEERDPRRVKMASLETHIDFRDLHRYITTPQEMTCIGVEELPWMMKAFGAGEAEYKAKCGAVIKRTDKMVKVRATITFNPCIIFDVDDLFLPQRTLDTHPKRRYNAVVRLANLTRWIVKAHEHKGVLTSGCSRSMIVEALKRELQDNEMKTNTSHEHIPVTEFLRAIRHVANEAEFEEQANVISCGLPHAVKGMPGEMPVLFCSRLYVTRHE